jgi:hypothetical protein
VPYREQAFQERGGPRCFCDQRTDRACACCGRPRCPAHLARRLCDRCNQAVARRLVPASGRAAALGLTTLAATWIAGMLAAPWLLWLGPPSALLAGVAAWRLARRRAIAALGPELARTVGELPPPPREPEPDAADPGVPPGVAGW